MTITQKIVNALIKRLTRILCRVDGAQLKKVPNHGPLIVVANHVNFMEVPVLITHLQPRPLNVISKVQTWDNPIKRYLFNMWDGIPLRMGEADLNAYQAVLSALDGGRIVGITPEGTRSHDGRLQVGHPGVVLLALRSGAPILPVVYYGSEHFWQNIRRLKRTDFHIVVGNPFHIDDRGEAMSRPVRDQIITEIMYQMAALLPPDNRGIYSDLRHATSRYLAFEKGVENNLLRAATHTPDFRMNLQPSSMPSRS
jgi:1-acyl-sn-glycerol-3-phosphate acyltransferase